MGHQLLSMGTVPGKNLQGHHFSYSWLGLAGGGVPALLPSLDLAWGQISLAETLQLPECPLGQHVTSPVEPWPCCWVTTCIALLRGSICHCQWAPVGHSWPEREKGKGVRSSRKWRGSFPEEPPRQEPRARMLCKGCCCVMGTWTVSCGCQGCSECPQPSPLQGCCSLWDTQAFNYPNYTCTIHGRQRNNSGSCRIFLKILSYLKIILNQTNGWGQQCYEQNSIGAGAQKPCILKASSSSVAGRGG